jgi:hypothetical protein
MSKRNPGRERHFTSLPSQRLNAPYRRRLRFEPLEDRRLLATLTVNTLSDVKLAGDGLVTLREAILAANTNTTTDLGQTGSGADTIAFAPGLSGTITLLAGELQITQALTINGPGQDNLSIDAQQLSRIFNFTSTSDAFTLRNLTLINGKTTGASQAGGAIRSASTQKLTLDHLNVASSGTTGSNSRGGGLFSQADVDIQNSTFRDNYALGDDSSGGGFYARDVVLKDSVLSGNTSLESGGGFRANVTEVVRSHITDNFGTGIETRRLTMTDCIISRNQGRGISLTNQSLYHETDSITGSTITDNSSTGIHSVNQLELQDCVVEGNGGGAVTTDFDLTAIRCTFDSNGGGLVTSSRGNMFVSESTISRNRGIGLTTDFGTITISDSLVYANRTTGTKGGGISTDQGTVIATNCVVSANQTAGEGGGIRTKTAILTNCTISSNRAQIGGGIFGTSNSGELKLINSAVIDNVATQSAGGIRVIGLATLVNATISGNRSAINGGGLYLHPNANKLSIANSTIADNHAQSNGGGIWSSVKPVEITASIVATNHAAGTGPDLWVAEAVPLQVYSSLIGENAGTSLTEAQSPDGRGNLIGSAAEGGTIDPLLAPLNSNGGFTPNHALFAGSPALDAISPPPTVAHNYQLNNSLADELGGPNLVSLGGAMTATGYDFSANQGLNLSSAISNGGNYGIEIVFSWDALSGGYQKILDFHNLTSDVGLYALGTGLNFVNGGFAPDVFVANQSTHLVLTRDDATDMLRAFVNGTEVWSYHDVAGDAVFDAPANIVRFFQDDTTSGQTEAEAGFVDRIRVFNVALDTGQVLALLNPASVPAFDQRGAPYKRIVDYDGVGGPRIDMGAYESQGVPSISHADYDANGNVDVLDYVIWRNSLGQMDIAPYSGADGNGDGDITAEDYTVWKSHFGDGLTITPPVAAGAGAIAAPTASAVDAAMLDVLFAAELDTSGGNLAEMRSTQNVAVTAPANNSLLLLARRSDSNAKGMTKSSEPATSIKQQTDDELFAILFCASNLDDLFGS